MFLAERYSPIGVDVGHRSLRCAQFARDNGQWRIHRLASIKSEPEWFEHSGAHSLATALARHIRSNAFYRSPLVISLPSPYVELLPLTIPASAENEAVAVRADVAAHLNCSEGEIQTDFVPLSASASTGVTRRDVLAVTARKAPLINLLEALSKRGPKVLAVEAAPLALRRVPKLLHLDPTPEALAIVDVELRQSVAVVLDRDTLVCCRRFNLGDEAFLRALRNALDMDDEQAWEILYGSSTPIMLAEHGVPFHEDDHTGTLRDILRPALEQFATELQRFLRYFTVQMKGKRVQRILLVGFAARQELLREKIFETTRVPISSLEEHFPAWQGLSTHAVASQDTSLSCFGVAMGLALRVQRKES